jgi:DivIVA domain-containing protein
VVEVASLWGGAEGRVLGAQGQRNAGDEHYDVPADVREASFPLAFRGYSCRVVDAYIERVNTVIAELEAGRSPRSAVRHALDRVGDQVGGILQRAREAAEEITTSARSEADDITSSAKAEAAELVVTAGATADRERSEAERTLADARAAAERIVAQADADAAERLQRCQEELTGLQEQAKARMQEIRTDIGAVWQERQKLLDGMHETAAQLETVASRAAVRFPAPEVVAAGKEQPTEEIPIVAADQPRPAPRRKPRTNANGAQRS